MKTTPLPETTVLGTDEFGVIRVGATRVTFDSVIDSFFDGASAETIADQYDSLSLAEVYCTIGYYLSHKAAMDEYLARSRQEEAKVREENERRFPPEGVRARLLASKRQFDLRQNAPVSG